MANAENNIAKLKAIRELIEEWQTQIPYTLYTMLMAILNNDEKA